MSAPKSPLDKPSLSQRRPSAPRRTSSEKSATFSSAGSKHGAKGDRPSSKPKESSESSSVKATSTSDSRSGFDTKQTREASKKSTELQVSGEQAEMQPDGRITTETLGFGQGANAADEVERLKAAMNAQIHMSQSRERLKKHLGGNNGRDSSPLNPSGLKARVSPIHEENTGSPSLDAAFASPTTSAQAPSTESGNTIRGPYTPAGQPPAGTPSYPFPSMRTPRHSYIGHRPFTALSPTVAPKTTSGRYEGHSQEQILSTSTTPASGPYFRASGTQQSQEDPNFPSPNLYELSLVLTSEPGLDPWWTNVCQIMTEAYQAHRVTLSIPADSTDIENVPWGQKATFNLSDDDGLSLNYIPRGTSLHLSSGDTNPSMASLASEKSSESPSTTQQARPTLPSRHSFTVYEQTKRAPPSDPGTTRVLPSRPSTIARAQSYWTGRPDQAPRSATLQNAQLNLEALQDRLEIEDEKVSASWENIEPAPREVRGRVFPVLQALDYETDPLIDSSGVLRVIERGKLVALTRDYPYLDDPRDELETSIEGKHVQRPSRSGQSRGKSEKARPEPSSRTSSYLSNRSSRRSNRISAEHQSEKGKSLPSTRQAEQRSPSTPKYEEYEQAPPSPWAQSPAPSPAVRVESADNPFFANTSAVEESFNPEQGTDDYSNTQNVEAIGIDRSWTVLHIPLHHPLLSRPVQSFRLDAAAMESRSSRRKDSTATVGIHDTGKVEHDKHKRVPIAIISILSPVIPYVANLRHSLEQLAPHLATSFSLCRNFSSLETEIAGLSRKRPHTMGFGALAPSGVRVGDEDNQLYSDDIHHRSSAGSVTSPSEYSGLSRSAHGSPAGTPGWDPSSVGLSMSKRTAESPGQVNAEGYFSARLRPGLGRIDTGSGSSATRTRRPSKESVSAESRQQRLPTHEDESRDQESSEAEHRDQTTQKVELEELQSSNLASRQRRLRRQQVALGESAGSRDTSPSQYQDAISSSGRQSMHEALPQAKSSGDRSHTLLHSYGAEFGATFQSLPATSAPSKKVLIQQTPARVASAAAEMPPPSDRLKGLIIESLPAHVFVALPQTGEIVWVNNRYLTYRGQTISDLHEDPWDSLHPDERDAYLKAWGHAVKAGEQFSMQVRIRRFDGNYRWFYTRAIGSKDSRGVIVQWYGSHMDIHDQHIAEVKAARQEEIEASEAKHRQLANLIPQIIFAATEDEGVTFANEQWLSYTGQAFDDALGLGFMDFVHPDDLAKCHFPTDKPPSPQRGKDNGEGSMDDSQISKSSKSSSKNSIVSQTPSQTTIRGVHSSLSRQSTSSSTSMYETPAADLSELANQGVIKVSLDSDGRQSYTTEVRIKNKVGEYRWHLVRCVEVDNISLGSRDGSWFGACTDINDQKLLESKLTEAMEMKSKFLSNMSHEIRTPLIGITGMIGFLQDTDLTYEQADYAQTCRRSCESLMNIINDILDLSKVDAGMMHMIPRWCHTHSLLEEVNEIVSTLAIERGVDLNYLVNEDVPPVIKADMVRVRQILLNIINNAAKFTDEGEIFTRCSIYRGDPQPNTTEDTPLEDLPSPIMLEFTTIDTGRGFTQEQGSQMFKPFSQVDGSSTRSQGGTGLGLVISRQLAGLHGGSLTGSAVPGKGATFILTVKVGLPTADDHPDDYNELRPVETPLDSTTPDGAMLAKALKQAGGNPVLANKFIHSPITQSPSSEINRQSPAAVSSSSSEAPSIHSVQSVQSQATHRSSASSLAYIEPFNEAVQVGGHEPSKMKLALPIRKSTSGSTGSQIDVATSQGPQNTTPRSGSATSMDIENFRPPMYSILIVCPLPRSREAITRHIETTLPKDIPHQITAFQQVEEVEDLLNTDDPVIFTHIVLNLPDEEQTIEFIDTIHQSPNMSQTIVVILSYPTRRQQFVSAGVGRSYAPLVAESRIRHVYKPIKPSRFALIFDPDRERELSTDRNRSTAQQHAANQKQSYATALERLGNKGYRVLLVEDNPVNQKVLLKYVAKLGVEVELAIDGQDCVEKVFSHDPGFYSIILVSDALIQAHHPVCLQNTLPHPYTLTKTSAICKCLERMDLRPAETFASGRRRITYLACPCLPCLRTSWMSQALSVLQRALITL